MDDLRTLRSLAELAELVATRPNLYVRWSQGPEVDTREQRSQDQLTGAELPGLSCSALAVEDWWRDRPLRAWVARRLYDYRHLRSERGTGVRPWVLEGHEVGRGPDNEPLVACDRPVAYLDEAVVQEAAREVDSQPADWGSLQRG